VLLAPPPCSGAIGSELAAATSTRWRDISHEELALEPHGVALVADVARPGYDARAQAPVPRLFRRDSAALSVPASDSSSSQLRIGSAVDFDIHA